MATNAEEIERDFEEDYRSMAGSIPLALFQMMVDVMTAHTFAKNKKHAGAVKNLYPLLHKVLCDYVGRVEFLIKDEMGQEPFNEAVHKREGLVATGYSDQENEALAHKTGHGNCACKH